MKKTLIILLGIVHSFSVNSQNVYKNNVPGFYGFLDDSHYHLSSEFFNASLNLKGHIKSMVYDKYNHIYFNEKGKITELKTGDEWGASVLRKWEYDTTDRVIKYSFQSKDKDISIFTFIYSDSNCIEIAPNFYGEGVDTIIHYLDSKGFIKKNYVYQRGNVIYGEGKSYKYDYTQPKNRLTEIRIGKRVEKRTYTIDGKILKINYFENNILKKSYYFKYSTHNPNSFQITETRMYGATKTNRYFRVTFILDERGNWTRVKVNSPARTEPFVTSRIIEYY